ncbi:MAG: right-handed parallel beta-helix repeat-containing protein [Candidatus Cloacimonetes bacterium]|nr:right-handed parallel beta-helix repeat-containing protein [Candidatus Cloacimonadota bacterium]
MKKVKGILLALFILLFSSFAMADVINVPADQPTIQQGLNTATEGDTVLVATGTYYENLFWPITNGIKLLSEFGADSTIIDGSNTSTVIYIFGATIDTTTVIEGFTLQNGTADAGGGISCLNASPIVENCVIENNEGGGCAFTNSISAVLINNEIKENNGIGIKGEENSNLYISECVIENNNDTGIYFHSSSGNVVDCNISENIANYGGGIYCNNSNPNLENVTILGNTAGD